MGIKIAPDYSKEQTCYFCGKRHATKMHSYSEPWYGILKKISVPIGVKYIKVDVEIPRCQNCERNHRYASIPIIILFLACFIIFAFLSIRHGGWTDHWYMIVLLVFIDTLISFFVSAFVGIPIRKIINALFYANCRDEEDTEDYEPIKRLKRIGFSRKNPDGLGSQSSNLVKEEALDRTLHDISQLEGFKVSD